MPRKGIIARRAQATDPVYDSDLVEKFICSMMWEGKKSTAQRVLRRHGPGGEEEQRRRTEDFQEGRREREAGAGSEDAARGRRELPGSRGSEPVPAAIAGDSLALAVFARTRRQDHDRQARR